MVSHGRGSDNNPSSIRCLDEGFFRFALECRLSVDILLHRIPSLRPCRAVKTFSRHTLRKRFRTAWKVLGAARLESLTIHHGRHTFFSHALAGGRSLAEVRDAAGHCNVSITSGYVHVAVDDDVLGNLFHNPCNERY